MKKELSIYKKPELAKLEEGIKIKDLSNQAEAIEKLVYVLLTDLGVGDNANEMQHIRVAQFIIETLNSYTVEEVMKAFDLFIMGEFEPMKPFQQLNKVVIGRVMREYEFYKREKLRLYRLEQTKLKNMKKPLSEAEQTRKMLDAVDRVKREVADYGQAKEQINNHHIYDWMVKSGRISKDLFSAKEKNDAIEKSKKIQLREFMESAQKDYSIHRNVMKVKKEIEDGNSPRTLKMAKSILISEYIKRNAL